MGKNRIAGEQKTVARRLEKKAAVEGATDMSRGTEEITEKQGGSEKDRKAEERGR